jgi:hypothetical protein
MSRCEVTLNPASPASVCCLCLRSDQDWTVTMRVHWDVGTFHLRCSPELQCCRLSRFTELSRSRYLAQHQQDFLQLLQSLPAPPQLSSLSGRVDSARHLLEAFKFLTYCELGTLALVSRQWRQASEHEELWKQQQVQLSSVPAALQSCSKHVFVYQFLRTCLCCSARLTDSQVEMICPRTGRTMCSGCFYDPEQGLQPLRRAATLLDVSKNTLKAAHVQPVVRIREALVLVCVARIRLERLREERRAVVLAALQGSEAPKRLVAEVVKLPLMQLAPACSPEAKQLLEFIQARTRKTLASSFLSQCLPVLTSSSRRH